MPHLTLEYTDNLVFDVQPLLARLNDELAATGVINLKGIKSRAVRLTDYRIAGGDPGYAFVHIGLFIREGRPLETRQDISRRLMEVIKSTFGGRFETGYLSLSVDIKELQDGVYQTLHNIPDRRET